MSSPHTYIIQPQLVIIICMQVSYRSSSALFGADKISYPRFFRLVPRSEQFADINIAIVHQFKWKRVAMVTYTTRFLLYVSTLLHCMIKCCSYDTEALTKIILVSQLYIQLCTQLHIPIAYLTSLLSVSTVHRAKIKKE